MARPGPEPKNPARAHGHNNSGGWIDVVNAPYDGPGSERDLPPLPGGMQWLPQVTGWWEIVRVMPHCRLWAASDWLFALTTAYQWQDWWSNFFGGAIPASASTELRRREDQMGYTLEARRKLGIRYIDPAQVTTEEPVGVDDVEPAEKSESGDAPSGVRPIGSARSRRQSLAG